MDAYIFFFSWYIYHTDFDKPNLLCLFFFCGYLGTLDTPSSRVRKLQLCRSFREYFSISCFCTGVDYAKDFRYTAFTRKGASLEPLIKDRNTLKSTVFLWLTNVFRLFQMHNDAIVYWCTWIYLMNDNRCGPFFDREMFGTRTTNTAWMDFMICINDNHYWYGMILMGISQDPHQVKCTQLIVLDVHDYVGKYHQCLCCCASFDTDASDN